MRLEDWAHLAIGLEIAAFFLVTPQFLGERVLKQFSSPIITTARIILAIPDLLIFGASTPLEPSEFFAKVQELVANIGKFWKTPRMRPLIVIVLLGGPLLVIAIILLLMSGKYHVLGYIVAGLVALSELLFIWALRFFLWRMFHSPAPSPSFSIRRWLVRFVIGPLLGIFFSVSLWGSLVPAYVLLKVSETNRLRNYLFGAGVLAFLVSKAIEYSLVH